MPLDHLPKDNLNEIIGLLPNKSLANLSLVCKYLCILVQAHVMKGYAGHILQPLKEASDEDGKPCKWVSVTKTVECGKITEAPIISPESSRRSKEDLAPVFEPLIFRTLSLEILLDSLLNYGSRYVIAQFKPIAFKQFTSCIELELVQALTITRKPSVDTNNIEIICGTPSELRASWAQIMHMVNNYTCLSLVNFGSPCDFLKSLKVINYMPALTELRLNGFIQPPKEYPRIKAVDFTNLSCSTIRGILRNFPGVKHITLCINGFQWFNRFIYDTWAFERLETVKVANIQGLLVSRETWKGKPKVHRLLLPVHHSPAHQSWQECYGHIFEVIEYWP